MKEGRHFDDGLLFFVIGHFFFAFFKKIGNFTYGYFVFYS
jgi:hypothetical protein